jgi:hypothetical protein
MTVVYGLILTIGPTKIFYMAQITINNGDSGATVRAALNSMFAELYGNIVPPQRFPGTSANLEVSFTANCYVSKIFLRPTPGASGTPNVTIGTTGGGNDIMPATNITQFTEINWSDYEFNADQAFFTISGGSVDITIIQVVNLF